MEGVSITSIMGDVGTVFTKAIEWAGDVGTEVVSTPILLLFCALPLVGLGVGLFKRLINIQ